MLLTAPCGMPGTRSRRKRQARPSEEDEEGANSHVGTTSFRLPVRNAVECLLLSVSVASTDDAIVEARLRNQADESVAAYLRRSLESFRPLMSSCWEPRLDPLSVDSFLVDQSAGLTEVRAHFKDVEVHGMSNFEVRCCAVSLGGLVLRISLWVPQVRVEGVYSLEGKAVGFLPLSGDGRFWVLGQDLLASGVALLTVEESHVVLSSLVLELEVEEVGVNFDNLFGGGTLGGVANNVVSALSKTTFERNIKPRLLASLEGALRTRLNEELQHLDALKVIHEGFAMGSRSNANIYMDQVLDKARDQIKHGGMDPLSLQDGPVFTEGQLVGLSSVYRSGDGNLSFSPQAVTLEAHLGFVDLRATYKWSRKVLLRLSGRVGARARDVSVFIRIRQPTTPGSNPVVESFEIERMGRISVDLSGLGPVSWVAQKLVSFLSNMMRRRIAERLRGPVRQIIENNLGSVNMPFG